jgi:DNA-directed RNA polymerase specialized sigma24 family protein
VDDDELLRELPFPLAAALRLRGAGASRAQIAAALDIAPEGVDAELELAARKLARRQREQARGSGLRATGSG